MRNVEFAEGYGVKLAKDFGNFPKGSLFYVDRINNRTIRFTMQVDKTCILELPTTFACEVFCNASGLSNGHSYTFAMDFPYMCLEEAQEFFDNAFIKKYLEGDNIVFKKGTKVIYLGQDMSGDLFRLEDGYEFEICHVDNMEEIEEVADLFIGTKN